jgi:hypothetical protein
LFFSIFMIKKFSCSEHWWRSYYMLCYYAVYGSKEQIFYTSRIRTYRIKIENQKHDAILLCSHSTQQHSRDWKEKNKIVFYYKVQMLEAKYAKNSTHRKSVKNWTRKTVVCEAPWQRGQERKGGVSYRYYNVSLVILWIWNYKIDTMHRGENVDIRSRFIAFSDCTALYCTFLCRTGLEWEGGSVAG